MPIGSVTGLGSVFARPRFPFQQDQANTDLLDQMVQSFSLPRARYQPVEQLHLPTPPDVLAGPLSSRAGVAPVGQQGAVNAGGGTMAQIMAGTPSLTGSPGGPSTGASTSRVSAVPAASSTTSPGPSEPFGPTPEPLKPPVPTPPSMPAGATPPITSGVARGAPSPSPTPLATGAPASNPIAPLAGTPAVRTWDPSRSLVVQNMMGHLTGWGTAPTASTPPQVEISPAGFLPGGLGGLRDARLRAGEYQPGTLDPLGFGSYFDKFGNDPAPAMAAGRAAAARGDWQKAIQLFDYADQVAGRTSGGRLGMDSGGAYGDARGGWGGGGGWDSGGGGWDSGFNR